MKQGRNDSCPCGSGLKYKKCCMRGIHKITNIESESEQLTTDRTIGPATIEEVFHEIDAMSGKKLNRMLETFVTRNPDFMTFVAMMEGTIATGPESDTLLDILALFRIFEKHYGRPTPHIRESDVTPLIETNCESITEMLGAPESKRLKPNPAQPFLIEFIFKRLLVRIEEEGLDLRETFFLLLLLKTTADVLDYAYRRTNEKVRLNTLKPALV